MRKYIDTTEYKKLQAELNAKMDGKHCVVCGNELPKYRRKYCSSECERSVQATIKDWSVIRWEAMKRDNFSCRDCGFISEKIEHGDLEVHHIIPIYAGGKEFDLDNTITLCHGCHMRRHARMNEEKRALREKQRIEEEQRKHFEEIEASGQKRLDKWATLSDK